MYQWAHALPFVPCLHALYPCTVSTYISSLVPCLWTLPSFNRAIFRTTISFVTYRSQLKCEPLFPYQVYVSTYYRVTLYDRLHPNSLASVSSPHPVFRMLVICSLNKFNLVCHYLYHIDVVCQLYRREFVYGIISSHLFIWSLETLWELFFVCSLRYFNIEFIKLLVYKLILCARRRTSAC